MLNDHGGVMGRLRQETRELHAAAENHGFQRALAKGTLPRETYGQWLGQMLLVHRSLEEHFRCLSQSIPAFGKVIRDHQYKEHHLLADLRALGMNAECVEPTPACGELIRQIDRRAAKNPIALLGFHYVLEGSTNGSKFIARAAQQAYKLTPECGLRYLDPYGESQREKWQAFKRDMESVEFTASEADLLVEAAREMFAHIASLGTDLFAVIRDESPATVEAIEYGPC